MKRIYKLSLFVGFVIILLPSCLRTEDDLFGESAALRLSRAAKETTEKLLSSPNGWIMEYFPTKDSCGITFLVNFRADKWATVAAKNLYFPAYAEDDGMWEVIVDQGEVLTFNTYNSVFHFFSDPHDIPQTLDDPNTEDIRENFELGRGLQGDYEFVILSATQDEIRLKGKKRATDIRLKRLPEAQDWPSYFQQLDAVHATLFPTKDIPLLRLRSSKIEYTLANGLHHVFSGTLKGADKMVDPVSLPFIITDYGIRLAQPFTINDQKVQSFKLTEEKDRLVCADNQVAAEIIGPDLAVILPYILKPNKSVAFSATTEKMSPALTDIYNQIKTELAADGGRRLNNLAFTKHKNGESALLLETLKASNKLAGFLSFSINSEQENELSLQLNTLTESYSDTMEDFYNGYVYYKNYPAIRQFVESLNGKFSLSIVQGSAWYPSAIKYTNQENPDIWFVLSIIF